MRGEAGGQSGAAELRVWRVQLSCGSDTHAPQAISGPRVLLSCQMRVAKAVSRKMLLRRLQAGVKHNVKCWQKVCLDNTHAHASSVAERM